MPQDRQDPGPHTSLCLPGVWRVRVYTGIGGASEGSGVPDPAGKDSPGLTERTGMTLC